MLGRTGTWSPVGQTSTPIDPRDDWQALLKAAGIRSARPHECSAQGCDSSAGAGRRQQGREGDPWSFVDRDDEALHPCRVEAVAEQQTAWDRRCGDETRRPDCNRNCNHCAYGGLRLAKRSCVFAQVRPALIRLRTRLSMAKAPQGMSLRGLCFGRARATKWTAVARLLHSGGRRTVGRVGRWTRRGGCTKRPVGCRRAR
jgi:hypothetical protein